MDKSPFRLTYVELLVICAIIVLAISIILPILDRSRETAGRVRCASNLRQIGQALLLYSIENGGAYPRTTYVPGHTVTPTWGTNPAAANPFGPDGPKPNDVTAAIFLLVRTQDIGTEVFICDQTNQERDDFGGRGATAQMRSNFTDVKKNLSYSFQNPYFNNAVAEKLRWDSKLPADLAIAADMNPGTSGEDDDVRAPTTRSTKFETLRFANSNNNDGHGQNILFGDGHVEFEAHPFAGIDGDNIFTTQAGTVIDSPASATDSILLPTDD